MPQAAAQDQWEDVTPGPVKVAAAKAVGAKPADEWEDVGPQPKTAPPPTPPAKPGFFRTMAQDIGSMVKPLVGAGGVEIEDPEQFRKKYEAMTPDQQAAQRAETRSNIRAMPTSDINNQERTNYAERRNAGQSPVRAIAETSYEAGAGANMTGFDEAVKQGDTAQALGHLAAPPALLAATHGVSKAIEHGPAMLGDVADAAHYVRGGIGDYIHDPKTGELTPKIANTSRAVGSLAGGATGYGVASVVDAPPYARAAAGAAGAGAGAVAAPSMLESAFPESDARTGARDLFTKTKETTEAQESALSENEKFDRAAEAKQQRLEKATEAAKKARDDAYIERGNSIQKQQAYQEKLDAAKTKADNALARSQRDTQTRQGADLAAEIERNKELSRAATEAAQENRSRDTEAAQAEDKRIQALHEEFARSLKELEDHRQKTLADRGRLFEQDAAARNRRGETKEKPGAAQTAAPLGPNGNTPPQPAPPTQPVTLGSNGSSPQDLISRTRKVIIPGDEPSTEDLKRAGDFTQAPLEKLKTLAKFGDKLAQNELNRRLKNE